MRGGWWWRVIWSGDVGGGVGGEGQEPATDCTDSASSHLRGLLGTGGSEQGLPELTYWGY